MFLSFLLHSIGKLQKTFQVSNSDPSNTATERPSTFCTPSKRQLSPKELIWLQNNHDIAGSVAKKTFHVQMGGDSWSKNCHLVHCLVNEVRLSAAFFCSLENSLIYTALRVPLLSETLKKAQQNNTTEIRKPYKGQEYLILLSQLNT